MLVRLVHHQWCVCGTGTSKKTPAGASTDSTMCLDWSRARIITEVPTMHSCDHSLGGVRRLPSYLVLHEPMYDHVDSSEPEDRQQHEGVHA